MIRILKAWFIRWRLEQYLEHREQMQADYHAGIRMISARIEEGRQTLRQLERANG